MNADDGIEFTLTPKKDSDFSYSIQMDGNLCPVVLDQVTRTSGCTIKLKYMNPTKTVSLVPDSSSATTINAKFPNSTKDFDISIGLWTVTVDAVQCFILECRYTIEFSVVKVSTPNVQILTDADKALVAKVTYTSESTLASTVSDMEGVIDQVNNANNKIIQIREDLEALNFNVTDLYPYQNFTDLRQDVLDLIAKIPGDGNADNDYDNPRNCDGPWNSITCWFQDFLAVLIGIAFVVAILVIGYCVCIKGGLYKKIVGKGGSKTQGSHIPEYRAD